MRIWARALGAAAAAAVATAVAAQTYLSMRDHGHAFGRILVWQLCCWLLWTVLGPPLMRRGGALAAPGSRRRETLTIALAVPALVAAHILIASWLTTVFQPYVPVVTYDYAGALETQFLSLLSIDLLACGVLVAVGYGAAVTRKAHELALRESRLETELAQAHLDALRLEIRPHFLFNTLNSIAALIRLRQNDEALTMLVSLSDLLRATVSQPPRQLVTLREELELVKRYVDLQHARFSDRVRVRYHVQDDVNLDRLVPSFLLQPVVENAFRHGAAAGADSCEIEVGVRQDDNVLHLWVSDDGVGLPVDFDLDTHAGTGLRNVRSRLEHLYTGAARLAVRHRSGTHGTVVDVLLPAEAGSCSVGTGTAGSTAGGVTAGSDAVGTAGHRIDAA
jgi:sensor histidine kinase YesM